MDRRLLASGAVMVLAALALAGLLLLGGDDAKAPPLAADDPDVLAVVDALESNSAERLFDLMASEGREGLNESAFVDAIVGGQQETGQVLSVEVTGEPTAQDREDPQFAVVPMEITYEHLGTESYRAAFVQQDGSWRLLLTNPG